MTTDQLEYWKLQEAKRSNLANENIKQQSVDIDYKDLMEKIRHNLSDEQIRKFLAEIEKNKYQLDAWYKQNVSGQGWSEQTLNWLYTIFSKMPKDATEGFANFGKGFHAIFG